MADVRTKRGRRLATPVDQLDLEGSFIATFPSQNEAHRVTGISQALISLCCNGWNYTAGGFRWRFAVDKK